MIHFLSLIYLSFAISTVGAATATNDASKIVRRAAKYFGVMVVGCIAIGWIMFILSE